MGLHAKTAFVCEGGLQGEASSQALPMALQGCPWVWEVQVHSVVRGVWVWCFPRSFVVMMGGEAVSGGGVLSCIYLAPQLVCGCSTRAPLAFFLAWGGWRQRGGCAGFLCRTGQVTVRERGR